MMKLNRLLLKPVLTGMLALAFLGNMPLMANSEKNEAFIQLKSDDFDSQNLHLSEYHFLLGSWRITMEMRNQHGEFQKLANPASMRAFVHEDQYTLQTIFQSGDGAFSTDLRTYDEASQRWRIQFLNAKKQRWQEFESRLLDGKMTTVIKNGYSGKEIFDVKTEQFPITPNQFLTNVFYSYDNGQNWTKVYIMTYDRVLETQ